MMKKAQTLLGILFIIAGFHLMRTPAYPSIKRIVMSHSNNIGLAVSVAMGIIFLAFSIGIFLLRKA